LIHRYYKINKADEKKGSGEKAAGWLRAKPLALRKARAALRRAAVED